MTRNEICLFSINLFEYSLLSVCYHRLFFLALVMNIVMITGILCVHCLVIRFACLVLGSGCTLKGIN